MNVAVRDAQPTDAPAITELLEEHALAAFGEPELGEDEVRSWFALPNFVIRVAERDGELVGYLDVHPQETGRFPADIRTLDTGVAGLLLDEAEQLSRERGAKAVRAFVQGDEPVLRQVLEAAGWKPTRHSFQMRVGLDGELAQPEWPDGLAPRNLRPGEERRVYEAHMEAFADHREHHRNVLGVRPLWRRRGLAKALLRHSFRDFRDRGATRVGLGVDGENTTGAVRLYEHVGMRVVRRTDTYEKTL